MTAPVDHDPSRGDGLAGSEEDVRSSVRAPGATPSACWGRGALLALGVIAGGAALLRLTSARPSLGVDEAFTVWLAGQGGTEFWNNLALDSHPPLLYFLVGLWTRPESSELMVRLPAIVLGVGLVLLVAVWARSVAVQEGEGAAAWLVPALLVACSSWLVTRDTEMRQYTLLTVLIALAMGGFWRACQGWRPGWVVYLACTTLSLYTQYVAFLMLPVPWLYAAWLPRGRRAAGLQGLALAQGGVCLLFAPWTSWFLHQSSHAAATAIRGFSDSAFAHTFLEYLSNWVVMMTVGPGLHLSPGGGHAAALVATAVAVAGLRAWPRPFAVFLFLFVVVPPAEAGALYMARGMNVFTAKHACFLSVPWFLLVGGALAGMLRRGGTARLGAALLLAIYLACNLSSWWVMRTDPPHQTPPWRDIALVLTAEARSGDAVVVVPAYHTLVYQHYARSLPCPVFSTDATRAADDARWLRGQFPRVWVIQTYHAMDDPEGRVAAAFDPGFRCVSRRVYPSVVGFDIVTVALYERTGEVRQESPRLPVK